jgi:hypothetical protein
MEKATDMPSVCRKSGHNGVVIWPLPPEIPWPQFLRLLRHPAPPRGWLEAAADLPELRKRPMLLRWIAQHPKAPAQLRNHLLPALPWRALAAIAADASAHPQARNHATERLQARWGVMTTGERRALAPMAPRQLWDAIWRVRDTGVLAAFLQHPRLNAELLEALVQPPLSSNQAQALQDSRWRGIVPVAHAVLVALDRSLARPGSGLVLGLGVTWILTLGPEECLVAASRLTHPPLRRMVRGHAAPLTDR